MLWVHIDLKAPEIRQHEWIIRIDETFTQILNEHIFTLWYSDQRWWKHLLQIRIGLMDSSEGERSVHQKNAPQTTAHLQLAAKVSIFDWTFWLSLKTS